MSKVSEKIRLQGLVKKLNELWCEEASVAFEGDETGFDLMIEFIEEVTNMIEDVVKSESVAPVYHQGFLADLIEDHFENQKSDPDAPETEEQAYFTSTAMDINLSEMIDTDVLSALIHVDRRSVISKEVA